MKCRHWTGKRKMGNPQSHSSCVTSLSRTTRSEIEALIYMLATCLLCIAPKRQLANKEQRLRHNKRSSRDEILECPSCRRIIRVM